MGFGEDSNANIHNK